MESRQGLVLHGRAGVPEERPRETIGEGAASTAVEIPEYWRHWSRRMTAKHGISYGVGLNKATYALKGRAGEAELLRPLGARRS